MRSTIINGITVTEGQKYRHIDTKCIYEIKVTPTDKFKFDNGLIHVDVTADRLQKVELITC